MQVVQSFLFSIGRGGLSLYEQRLLLSIVDNVQVFVKGKVLKKLKKNDINLPHYLRIVVDVSTLLTDGSTHYNYVREAARSLARKTIEYWDTDGDTWRLYSIIDNVFYAKRSGQLSFTVNYDLLSLICDFSKGFSRYELNTAIQLSTSYTVRLYSLLNSMSSPYKLSIQDLRNMFCCNDKYSRNSDFIKRIIEPAKQELDMMQCNSFDYQLITKGRKITHILFIPIRRQQQTTEQLAAQASLSFFVEREVYLLLLNYMGFTYKELSCHKILLKNFCSLPASLDRLQNIYDRAKRKSMEKGYIINAMKSEVTNNKQLII